MAAGLRFGLVGTGSELVACGKLLLARGHQVVGVVSDCPEVGAWSRESGVGRVGHEEAAAWPAGRPIDYLLSIVNHRLLSPEILAAPLRGAINYHDSLLPRYAGFNAAAWAILDGQTTHGVTWHEMTAEVDRGPILVQSSFEISPDDTAFSLSVKCSEAGVSSFDRLLGQLETDSVERRVQDGPGSFHLRSDRPGLAFLDFSRPAAELYALVRALDFGTTDNWMATPKLAFPGGFLSARDARLAGETRAAPGTVLSIADRGILIAARVGALEVSALATLDGLSIGPVEAASRFGLVVGERLPALDGEVAVAAHAFDAVATKSERFWARRIASLRPAALADLTPHSGPKRPAVLGRPWPSALADAPNSRRQSAVIAAFAACVHRLGGGATFDFATPASVSPSLRPFYASIVPFRCRVDSASSFGTLLDEVATEMAACTARRTYARDAVLRYPELGLSGQAGGSLAIGVQFGDPDDEPGWDGTASLPDGSHLSLVAAAGAGYAFGYDESAMSAKAAEALAQRVEVILAAGLDDLALPIHALPILLPEEQERLLGTWQETARPFESDLCVHQFFERQVLKTPEATAVVFGESKLTYRELNRRTNQLAQQLRAAGVGPDTLVAVCVERSLDLIVGLLGILKAGGAYVPMDPAYPRDRLAMMLEDSKVRFLVAQSHLTARLPAIDGQIVLVDRLPSIGDALDAENPGSGVGPENLAYVIFTSGSTGRPKGTMLEHRNVANFFAGMDTAVAGGNSGPGVWLAVTSISFDISVLELLWTLARGFEVVIAPETDRASVERRSFAVRPSSTPMGFGLFYFAADSGTAPAGDAYRLLIEGAKFADTHGFAAVWTPERHFHAFGGLYPNPAITTAAIATITSRIHLRAGSVVLPLHNPLRVAEDWAMIDQLSGGRVGLSFASGWHVNDFAFMPDNYERRREVMLEHIDVVMKLWRGETVSATNGAGQPIEVSVLPRPLQERPPIWIAAAGSPATFALAGRLGFNILTNMLGQDLADLKVKFAAYRAARREHGHEGDGVVSVMLHTFVCGDTDEARRLARKPLSDYLASSFDLVKVAPTMFPAFRQPSRAVADAEPVASPNFTPEDMAALVDHAFERYFGSSGLFGTPEHAIQMVDRLQEIGATEVACLVDFGIDPDVVLASLPHLHRLQEMCRERAARAGQAASAEAPAEDNIATLIRRHRVTHMQCTPSMARMLASDPESLESLGRLDRLMVGGEAFPPDLAAQLATAVSGRVLNMYGPTETTIWSTTSTVAPDQAPTIGRPIANTSIRILDEHQQLVPIGTPGELYIGGFGVARGYLGRPDLTAERFIPDPWDPQTRLYRTGDLARYRPDGEIEFLGRLDHQVKVNGYRIELGDIETALNRHPLVRQSVVAAPKLGATAGATLVAYVVPEASAKSLGSGSERVRNWQTIWNETYAQSLAPAAETDARFRISGWNDSYDGEPIGTMEMREWLDRTVERIGALKPKRVLEIGCGTGLILYRVVGEVDHYAGVDLSSAALQSIQAELTEAEAAKVSLAQRAAHELDHLEDRSFDLVVINSVAQYFPDASYLVDVLRRATDLAADGGHIFVGDVRSLAHLAAFHTSVALHQAAADTSAADLRSAIEHRIGSESELVLSEGFFHAVVNEIPRLSSAEIHLKRGQAHNELSMFRYDVVLHVEPSAPEPRGIGPKPVRAASLEEVRIRLAEEAPVVHLTDVANARLSGVATVCQLLASNGAPGGDAEALRRAEERGNNQGVDPDQLYGLHPGYDVEVRWARSGNLGNIDAVFRSKVGGGCRAFDPPPQAGGPSDHANVPGGSSDGTAVIKQLRSHLQSRLPEYMMPSAFVFLNELPLTSNGKIDRKALPDPERRPLASEVPYSPPSSTLEQQIGGIWQDLLGVDRVGRQDNIFDLGANSLLTMQANSRLSALLARKVSLVSMFRFPTIAALAAHLDEGAAQAAAATTEQQTQERSNRSEQAATRRRALRAERSDR